MAVSRHLPQGFSLLLRYRALAHSRASVGSGADCIDGLEALSQVVMYDVVVTDLAMSGRDGRWLVEQVKMSARPVPVIAITGYEPDYGLTHAPFARVLTKPVEPDALAAEILRVVGRPSA